MNCVIAGPECGPVSPCQGVNPPSTTVEAIIVRGLDSAIKQAIEFTLMTRG